MESYTHLFKKSLSTHQWKLHFAAHSHHLWPDVTEEAHNQAWLDAASFADLKWAKVFEALLPEVAHNICSILSISSPQSIVFAPNTHELMYRILSCFPTEKTCSILTTDSEFHSASRQFSRLEEEGFHIEKIPTQPFSTFPERFLKACSEKWDLIFFSQVFFNSGFALTQETLEKIVFTASVHHNNFIMIDGYHGYMARPTHLKTIEEKAFYLAGGYKYAMAGEGACFMHVPNWVKERPRNTGWFAGFEDLNQEQSRKINYPTTAQQFAGSTFDPSGIYRMRAVQNLLQEESISVEKIHQHVKHLQAYFLQLLIEQKPKLLNNLELITQHLPRGHFLTFKAKEAVLISETLQNHKVIVDSRGDRLRFGFGLYHTQNSIDELFKILSEIK